MSKKKESFGKKLERELRRGGIPFKIAQIQINPRLEAVINEYVMGIEEAHKKAAKSKLFFRQCSQGATS